jgi:hypothetical protein
MSAFEDGPPEGWEEVPPEDDTTEAKPEGDATFGDPIDIIGDSLATGWPVLTADCLPSALFRYVMAEAERLSTDACPIGAHVIAACSTAASDGWRIKPKRNDPWTQQPRIWTCVVKDVGARGTEMIRAAYWPLKEEDRENHKAFQAKMVEWMARQEALPAKARGKSDDPRPTEKRLLTNDGTVEALSEILRWKGDRGKVGVLCDELVTLLGSFGRYTAKGGASRAQLLEAYDGGPQRIDRVIRGAVYVPNWSISVAGNIQPRRLAAMADDLHDDGLFQRFMTIHAAPTSVEDEDDDKPINPAIGDDYRSLIRAIRKMVPAKSADDTLADCYVCGEGVAIRRRFMKLVKRLSLDPSLPTIIRETASKWSGLLARLALVFHIVNLAERELNGEVLEPRDKAQVPAATVEQAATFIRKIAMPNLFRLGYQTMPDTGEPAGNGRWIAEHILAHKLGHITARDIGRARRQLRGKHQDIADAMAVLEHAGWARLQEIRSDGMRWEINLKVHEQFAEAAEAEAERRKAIVKMIREKVTEL